MNNCRVLLADDEAAILEGYKLLFDWEKYQCEVVGTAMDGREAVEKARELKPDIVIMDINLPKLNGLEAIRAIQETAPADHPLYMIVVTGYDEFSYCPVSYTHLDVYKRQVPFLCFSLVPGHLALTWIVMSRARKFITVKVQTIRYS